MCVAGGGAALQLPAGAGRPAEGETARADRERVNQLPRERTGADAVRCCRWRRCDNASGRSCRLSAATDGALTFALYCTVLFTAQPHTLIERVLLSLNC